MKAAIRNENGMTLVELLAVLALLSMVTLLISNTHIFGQKQFSSQSEQIQHESNVRYTMNVITKEIRTSPQSISVANNTIKISNVVFKLQNTTLYKNDTVLEEGIEEFTVKKSGNEIMITIKSEPNQFEKTASLSTNLYIRE
jgi:prepilin-type N-terminal cleavage/methylation domain-containing protein